jgi:hypothetical protein
MTAIFLPALAVAFSGAIMPGPLLTATDELYLIIVSPENNFKTKAATFYLS